MFTPSVWEQEEACPRVTLEFGNEGSSYWKPLVVCSVTWNADYALTYRCVTLSGMQVMH